MEKNEDISYTMLLRGNCWRAFAVDILGPEHVGDHVNPLSNKPLVDQNNNWLYGLGQAGFSIHLLPLGEDDFEFVLGCPGIKLWHGNQIHISIPGSDTMDELFFERAIDTFGYSG